MSLHRMVLVEMRDSETNEVVTTIPTTERRWEQWCAEAQRAGLTRDEYLGRQIEFGLAVLEEATERLGIDEVRRIMRHTSPKRWTSELVAATVRSPRRRTSPVTSKVDEATPSSFGTE
jgi:hypothetical protein